MSGKKREKARWIRGKRGDERRQERGERIGEEGKERREGRRGRRGRRGGRGEERREERGGGRGRGLTNKGEIYIPTLVLCLSSSESEMTTVRLFLRTFCEKREDWHFMNACYYSGKPL